MSDENKNEILEEQRKARQEFLELKKMQHGEMKTPPKPSEIALVPKTPKEKWNNFWFQYKWHVFLITVITVVFAVLIAQCATRTKYDLKVVYFTYTTVLDEQMQAVEDYIKQYASDTNGDGEINVQIINCSCSNSSNDTQYQYSILTKIQTLLAGDWNALLYITDSESYKYLDGLSDDSIFEGEPYKFGEDFYTATENENLRMLPEGLQISCRSISDTILEDKKDVDASYKAAKAVLDGIRNNQKTEK